MPNPPAVRKPPFCPNPRCPHHASGQACWRWKRAGFFTRHARPQRIQRFQCCHCRRHFSEQTFRTCYWLKRPELLEPIFHRLVGCSGFRQIAREFAVSPQSVLGQAARLGRHCLLVHEQRRPHGPIVEPIALDSFESFEYSQYHPTRYHVVAGRESHFFYGFTDSECRRSGRMSEGQRRTRARLEARLGRPDPRSTEREVAALLQLLAPRPQPLTLHTDQHTDYPRALRRLGHLAVEHRTISSRAARTPRNPLFPINLLDLLIRHGGANHKRETIAFSKRRQSAIERLWVFLVWRNYIKSFSERRRDGSPAMRLGRLKRRLTVREVLAERRFISRIGLPPRWVPYYRREIPTRRFARIARHARVYAA
jgi:transposase-like protein